MSALVSRGTQIMSKSGLQILHLNRKNLAPCLSFPVFSKTNKSRAHSNNPVAIYSHEWYKTNSIKKRNCNRFDLLNICKHWLHRNEHIKLIVIVSVIIATTGNINFILSLNWRLLFSRGGKEETMKKTFAV